MVDKYDEPDNVPRRRCGVLPEDQGTDFSQYGADSTLCNPEPHHQSAGEQKAPHAGDWVTVDLAADVAMAFVWIPPGDFMMGSPDDEEDRDDSESPLHRVTFPRGFWLGKYPVTQSQWQSVMGSNPSHFKGDGRLPVEQVPWSDCQQFVRTLNQKGAVQFRMPSEAEWEYACRAGTTTPFHFGETICTDQANYNGIWIYGSGQVGFCRGKTTPVGSFPANAWGLHDMHGNVAEWCEDDGHSHYVGAPDDGSAWVDTSGGSLQRERCDWRVDALLGSNAMHRGGAWCYVQRFCRSAARVESLSFYTLNSVGFRIMWTA